MRKRARFMNDTDSRKAERRGGTTKTEQTGCGCRNSCKQCCNVMARRSRPTDYRDVTGERFMVETGNPLILSRRNVLMLMGGLAVWRPLNATSSEFWNKKAPGDWSPEEIDKLITKSPWAREASAQGAAPGRSGSPNGSPGGSPNGTGYPGGSPGGMGGPRIGIPGIGGIGGM